jgi:hypothetical protein
VPNDDSPRVSLLRSRFTSLGSQWDDLRHVIICPSLGFKPQETVSGFLRYRVHEAVWRATPYVTSLDFEPFPEHWFIIQGKLVAGCFFDAQKIRQDGDPTLPHKQEADGAQDVKRAIDEFNRLASEAADCFRLESRRGQPPCANDSMDRWIEYLYEVIDPAEQYLPAPFLDRWWFKELPANVFLSSAELIQRPIAKRAVLPIGKQSDKVTNPPGRKVPEGKLKLGQTLQFDWLTYLAPGKPNDENEDYHDWRVEHGLSGDFDVSRDKAKALRRWFAYDHLRGEKNEDDRISLEKGFKLSEDDKTAITDWLTSQKEGK